MFKLSSFICEITLILENLFNVVLTRPFLRADSIPFGFWEAPRGAQGARDPNDP